MRTVAGLLVQRDDRTLLVFKKGYWFFPGGKLEAGETSEIALQREVAEELGMGLCGEPKLICRSVFDSPEGERFCFDTFRCGHSQLSGTPRLNPRDTVTEFAWVDQPQELNLTEHTRFILEHLHEWSWAA